ncbi:hypothetical protein MARPU_00755 [Marichromatium purpuratum 984]|uniref:Uncharacterized protein n=1 Tax=Marichromatium purpuratum 984 TaxID=765910 RepID=W0E8F6_MARPU|nr:hypothetical protein [Marichromatium purpuratum]AHF05331.1 hypothetical protein MARPU_00755 [Marichromatium purpuratum 984]
MEGSSIAALELALFLGLFGWLMYAQFGKRKRDDHPPRDERSDQDEQR